MRTTRYACRGLALLVILAAAGLSSYAATPHKVLRLRLDGPLTEAPNDAAAFFAMLSEEDVTSLREIVSTIRQAAQDHGIDGLLLIVEQPQMKLAQAEEVCRAIQYFRSKNKPVYGFMDAGSNLAYVLAANCDHLTLAENSELDIVGLYAAQMYFKGLLDKIGVQAEMVHIGDYKSFIEPFTRTEPSAPAAENINWLLDSIYERWIGLIAEGRKLTPDDVRKLVDAAPLSAAQALDGKLVDAVGSFADFKQRIHKEFGEDVEVLKEYKPQADMELDVDNPFALFSQLMTMLEGGTEEKGPAVGLIYVDGMIVVGKSDDDPFGGRIAGSTSIRAALEQAREDDSIKAVVLRVDSPGGSALASDIIWDAANRLKQEKPFIVSMGGVAASGGYYVSCPGDTIFAEGSTITASIGVGGGKMIWKQLMEEKLGITSTEFTRGKHAGIVSMNRPWNESERAWIESMMQDVYKQFKGRIEASRGDRLKKELESIAGGRVYSGAQALTLGLVDQLGGVGEALDYAAEKAGLGRDYEVRVLPKKSDFAEFVKFLKTLSGKQRGRDEFEVSVLARLGATPLTSTLPLLQQVAPQQVEQLVNALRHMVILQRERVSCFAPLVPTIR